MFRIIMGIRHCDVITSLKNNWIFFKTCLWEPCWLIPLIMLFIIFLPAFISDIPPNSVESPVVNKTGKCSSFPNGVRALAFLCIELYKTYISVISLINVKLHIYWAFKRNSFDDTFLYPFCHWLHAVQVVTTTISNAINDYKVVTVAIVPCQFEMFAFTVKLCFRSKREHGYGVGWLIYICRQYHQRY